MIKPILLALATLFLWQTKLPGQPVAQKKVLKLMGCRFELTAASNDEAIAWQAINAGIEEIERIERLISSWDKNSQTSEINRNAGVKPVKVKKELFNLIFRSKKVATLTNGAFDISFASMDRVWKFDGSMQTMPSPEVVAQARRFINWKNIELNSGNQTVFLKEKGMKIGFGAIGKGYAANRAKVVMEKIDGIVGGVVNASGDLICWGETGNEVGQIIKIADPKNQTKALSWLQIQNTAVVTSGDYERFVNFDEIRYAHIIDPRSGYPTTGVKSVTVICPDAELADALATSVFVLGKDEGLKLINGLKGVECLVITDNDKLLSSDNLKLNFY